MKLIGYVKDEEAKTLMRDCEAFLFPVFYEGFGIPPMEALSAGAKEIIVSDIEVMHEVYENRAIYIDPYNYEYDFSELIKNKKERGNNPLAKYSWECSAELLYNTLFQQ